MSWHRIVLHVLFWSHISIRRVISHRLFGETTVNVCFWVGPWDKPRTRLRNVGKLTLNLNCQTAKLFLLLNLHTLSDRLKLFSLDLQVFACSESWAQFKSSFQNDLALKPYLISLTQGKPFSFSRMLLNSCLAFQSEREIFKSGEIYKDNKRWFSGLRS